MAGAIVSSDVKRRGWGGVWLVVVLYLLVTAWLSFHLNVWRDEMYSLHTSSGSVGRAARQGILFELQPPVYFAALAAWRTLGDSIFFARLLSSLFGAGAVLVIARIADRWVPRVRPAYAAALLASHPFLIWAGTEIRVYALVILLSALLTLAFLEAYWRPEPSRRARLMFAGVALVSLYTQFYLSLLLVCFGVALLARRGRPSLWAYVVDAGAVMALSLPLVLALRAQFASHRGDLGRQVGIGVETLRLVVARFEAYLFSFNDAIDQARWSLPAMRAARWAYRALIFATIGVGLVLFRRKVRDSLPSARPETGSLAEAWPFVAAITTYAVCMAGIVVAVGPMSVGARHTAGLLVPALLAVTAAPAVALGRSAAVSWVAILVASNVAATTLVQFVPLAKDCDCRRVAEAITEHEASREPILIFPSEDVMPLAVYYHGKNHLVPVPSAPSYEHWDQSTFVIRSPDDVADALVKEAPGGVGLWVHTNTYGPGWGPEKLEAFLAHGFREDQKYEFAHGVVLRHFVPGDLSAAQ